MTIDDLEPTREATAPYGRALSSALAAFATSTHALAEAPSAAAAFGAIAASAAAATHADVALVRVLERDGHRLAVRGVWSASEVVQAELVGSRVPASQLPDVEVDERGALPAALRTFAERVDARAILVAPVRVDGRTVAALELLRRAPSFDADERAFARLAADQVALAIRALERDGSGAAAVGLPRRTSSKSGTSASRTSRTASSPQTAAAGSPTQARAKSRSARAARGPAGSRRVAP